MTKTELKEKTLEAVAQSPRAKHAVIIAFVVDTTDEKGNPVSVWQKASYDGNETRNVQFHEKLAFLPTRALRFVTDENNHLKFEELVKQFDSDFNRGKIELLWDGPAEAIKAAEAIKSAPAKEPKAAKPTPEI